jgi:hypothetical protein
MERNRIKRFEDMREDASAYAPGAEYDEAYNLYLKGLVDSGVFADDESARNMARKVKDKAEALRIAAWAEKDSILFYYEMRNLVGPSGQPTIDAIITEEKAHLRDITNIRRMLLD